MNVLHVNNCDLPGRAFNGYDLHLSLIEKGIASRQIVMDKYSDTSSVDVLEHDDLQREYISYIEERHCVKNTLFPYAHSLIGSGSFQDADIVHFHFPYHNMFSLLDYDKIMDSRSVWTVHDLWPVTGNCTNPLDCKKWLTGCGDCNRFDDKYFPMKIDNTRFMWEVKREAYKDINPHIIVSTDYMANFIRQSPLTCHFSDIHIIPFGVKLYKSPKRKNNRIVIGFRADESELKGCSYLFNALVGLKGQEGRIELQCVDDGSVPREVLDRYVVKRFGWINDRDELLSIMSGWDIFVMPSIAESFGLMAIEALMCKCAVLCFDNTVIAELTKAPKFAMAASYRDYRDLQAKLEELIEDSDLRKDYQEKGYDFVAENFDYELYIKRHIELYNAIAG